MQEKIRQRLTYQLIPFPLIERGILIEDPKNQQRAGQEYLEQGNPVQPILKVSIFAAQSWICVLDIHGILIRQSWYLQ